MVGGVRAFVVVDDDDQRPVPGRRDAVQGLPGHASGERAVADDGDDVSAPPCTWRALARPSAQPRTVEAGCSR